MDKIRVKFESDQYDIDLHKAAAERLEEFLRSDMNASTENIIRVLSVLLIDLFRRNDATQQKFDRVINMLKEEYFLRRKFKMPMSGHTVQRGTAETQEDE